MFVTFSKISANNSTSDILAVHSSIHKDKSIRITHFSCNCVFVDFCVECVHIVRRVLCILFFTFLHHCYVIFLQRTRRHNRQHRLWLQFHRFIEINRSELLMFRAVILLVDFCAECVHIVRRVLRFLFFTFPHHCYVIFVQPTLPHNIEHRFRLYLRRFIEINHSVFLLFRAVIFCRFLC